MKSFQYLLLSLLITPIVLDAGNGRLSKTRQVTVLLQSQPDHGSLVTTGSIDDIPSNHTETESRLVINANLEVIELEPITLSERIVTNMIKVARKKENQKEAFDAIRAQKKGSDDTSNPVLPEKDAVSPELQTSPLLLATFGDFLSDEALRKLNLTNSHALPKHSKSPSLSSNRQ